MVGDADVPLCGDAAGGDWLLNRLIALGRRLACDEHSMVDLIPGKIRQREIGLAVFK